MLTGRLLLYFRNEINFLWTIIPNPWIEKIIMEKPIFVGKSNVQNGSKSYRSNVKFILKIFCCQKNNQQGGRNSKISGEAAKKIQDKFANLLNFLHFQPLISGEAAASPASPVPTPLKINYFTKQTF